MSTSVVRRSVSTAVAALLAVGAVPLLGATPAHAGIASYSPSQGNVTDGALRFRLDWDEQGPPFSPLTDEVQLRRTAAPTDVIVCTRPAAQDPNVSTPETLYADCNVRGRAPGRYDLAVERGATSAGDPTEPTYADLLVPEAFSLFSGVPKVTAVSPSSRATGAPVTSMTISGAYLTKDTVVDFLVDGTPDPGVVFTPAAWPTNPPMNTMSGTIEVKPTAIAGPHTVRVRDVQNATGTLPNGFTVVAGPQISGITPPGVGQNATGRVVVINGSNFGPNMSVALSPTATDVTLGTPVVASATQIHVPVTTTAGATVGQRSLVLTNNDNGGRATGTLNINPRPTISTVAPATRGQGSMTQQIVVTGTNFSNLAGERTQFVLKNPNGVTLDAWTVDSATQATLTVTVPPTATVGSRPVVATNFDGGTSDQDKALNVTDAPSPTSVDPGSAPRGTTKSVKVKGNGFTGTPTVDFGPGITATVTNTTLTELTVLLNIAANATQGPRDVKVTNPDAGTRTCAACFYVDGLVVDRVVPFGSLNGDVRSVTIEGSGFSSSGGAPAVTFVPADNTTVQPTIRATDVVVSADGTSITANVDLTMASPQLYTVRVVNANGDSGTCSRCFTVASPTPVITSVSPNSRVQGAQNQPLTITGQNFSNGTRITFENPAVTVDSTTVESPTTIKVVVDVTPLAAEGASDVTATLINGAKYDCDNCFTVSGTPTVTQVSPNNRGLGTTGNLTLTGTKFAQGATVSFGNPKITVNGSPTVASATSMTVNVTIASDATPGATSVTVTNPDTGSGGCPACFTVNPKPTATSVTPNKGGVGKTVNVTVNGAGFTPGAPSVHAGDGVAVTNATWVSASAVTATFTISPSAALGARTVTVTLADGAVAPCADCFSVVSSPTVSSVAPNARSQGTTGTITVSGTGFSTQGGQPTLGFSGTGLTATNVQVTSPTTLTAVLAIDPAAPTGGRVLTVTNADGGVGACASTCFTVQAGPTLASAAPNSAARGRNGIEVTLTGEGFASDAQPLFGTGIAVVGTPVVTVNPNAADTIVAIVDVAPDAATGARALAVRNPADGATGVCNGCFTVLPGRLMTVEVFDTKGTASTADDALIDKPVSGTGYRVRVTAKTDETAGSATDTSFAGPIELTAADDGKFVPGTCTAAASGVATCSDVKFGDLGSSTLTARGTEADADRRGTVGVVTQPTGLVFTSAPTKATLGEPATYTFAPTVGISGADPSGYAATRRIELTGDGANIADGSTLSCPAATCSVQVTWSTGGAKTIQVVDGSTPPRATPVLAVDVVDVGLYRPLSPSRILDTRRSGDGESFSSPLGAGQSITLPVAGRGGVPSSGASAVVVNVTVTNTTGTSYLTVWPNGEARPFASTLNFVKGETVANLAVLKLGSGGAVRIYNAANSTHAVMDVVGYYTDDAAGAGGRLVSVQPARVFNTAFGGPIGPGQAAAATVVGTAGVPANDVSAVVLSVTAVRPTESGFLTVYPDGEARPLASTLNYPAGRTVANLAYAKVGDNGKIRVYNPRGSTGVTLDVLGYVTKSGAGDLGRFVALSPSRIFDTRDGTGGVNGRVNAGQVVSPKVTGIPSAGLPASGISAVVVNVTVTRTTGTGYLTVYPSGSGRPGTSNVQWVAGQTTANLALAKVGPDGRISLWNSNGATHVILDVVGYLTS